MTLKYFQDDANPPSGSGRTAALSAKGGWCYQQRQAFTVAIDQYAEEAPGNREYFLDKPYSIGSGKTDHVS